MTPARLGAAGLRQLAEASERFPPDPACPCRLHAATSWESITEDRWPAKLMEPMGTLRDPSLDEPTFEEFHPHGTRYDSADAPIAVHCFPFNRCQVYRCRRCSLLVLRYTEYGGYYVDHRVRVVAAALIVEPG